MEVESKVMPCLCAHTYQDQRYGLRMRYHNPCKTGYRCSVCKNEVHQDKPTKKLS